MDVEWTLNRNGQFVERAVYGKFFFTLRGGINLKKYGIEKKIYIEVTCVMFVNLSSVPAHCHLYA